MIACGTQGATIRLIRSWDSSDKFSRNAYDYFRLRGDEVTWLRVIWDFWSMPQYNFILWLAVLGKLRTKDRLQFMSPDPICLLYSQDNESHRHLFFTCYWSAQLWSLIKSWLRVYRQMSSLSSALRGLNSGSVGSVWLVGGLAVFSGLPGSVYLSWGGRVASASLGAAELALVWSAASFLLHLVASVLCRSPFGFQVCKGGLACFLSTYTVSIDCLSPYLVSPPSQAAPRLKEAIPVSVLFGLALIGRAFSWPGWLAFILLGSTSLGPALWVPLLGPGRRWVESLLLGFGLGYLFLSIVLR
ncbi:hypothetical protein OIU76_001155 [Salix suchowensis]|nr:hypothetical protein OIU76_001155 [Salix suchowensis]